MRSRRYRDSTILHIIPEISGLTVSGAALAYISTIIGSGIVSLPFALYQAGTSVGLFLHCMMVGILMGAVVLYLKTKDNLGYE